MSAINFKVTLFIGSKIESFKLGEVLQKVRNGHIPANMLGNRKPLLFPFEETDGVVYDISEKRRRLKGKMHGNMEDAKKNCETW